MTDALKAGGAVSGMEFILQIHNFCLALAIGVGREDDGRGVSSCCAVVMVKRLA